MKKKSKKHSIQLKRIFKFTLVGAAGLILALVLASILSNQFLPSAPDDLQHLSRQIVVHTSEALNLLGNLGSKVWPGFNADLPIIIWNEETAFLINYPDPLPGWEQMTDHTINGLPVYNQPNMKPYQAFTEVLPNGDYAGSMATKNAMNREFIKLFKHNLPPIINQIFPYRLLLHSTDFYLTTLVHETFHAYQAENYPSKFEDVEKAYSKHSAYEGVFKGMADAWAAEIKCLQKALKEENQAERASLVYEFLEIRTDRRKAAGLTPNLELYEKRFEWLEGSTKYVELEVWENAASGAYHPAKSILQDQDFHSYQGYENRWKTELKNMERAAKNGGETLFYYTGMLQARLLDDLLPGWKSQMGDPEVWLEDLLREAVSSL